MHELFVTEQIRDIALRYATEAGAGRITALHLVVGELSSIVDDSVQFYWDFVSEGTIAAGAQLHFRRLPARLACQQCGGQYGPDEGLTCPACDSSDVRVIQGDEFYLDAIDVAERPQPADVGPPAGSG